MKRTTAERHARAIQATHSHRWESKDPDVYLSTLRALCRREAGTGWFNVDIMVASAVGAYVEVPEGIAWLRNFARSEIQKQLAAGSTVIDQLLAIYNLCTRLLEASNERMLLANTAAK